MKIFLIYTFSVLIILLSGCNKDKIPGVYRIDIQQGNAIDQGMINKLKLGMTKHQVAYVMGTPLIIDTFHPNRWDYIYSFHPGNGQREQRNITLFFTDDETLSHIEGNTRTVAREDLPQEERKEANVVVPLDEKETGVFQGLLNTVGLGEDEPEKVASEKKTDSDVKTADEAKSKEASSDSMDDAIVEPEAEPEDISSDSIDDAIVEPETESKDVSSDSMDDATVEPTDEVELKESSSENIDDTTVMPSDEPETTAVSAENIDDATPSDKVESTETEDDKKTGIFQGLLNTIGLGDDDESEETISDEKTVVEENDNESKEKESQKNDVEDNSSKEPVDESEEEKSSDDDSINDSTEEEQDDIDLMWDMQLNNK